MDPADAARDVTAYGDPDYRAARAALHRTPTPCWRGCGRIATSPDHVPPLADHDHRRGSGCCELLPSCAPCNLGAGARAGNRRRSAARPTPTTSRRW